MKKFLTIAKRYLIIVFIFYAIGFAKQLYYTKKFDFLYFWNEPKYRLFWVVLIIGGAIGHIIWERYCAYLYDD